MVAAILAHFNYTLGHQMSSPLLLFHRISLQCEEYRMRQTRLRVKLSGRLELVQLEKETLC